MSRCGLNLCACDSIAAMSGALCCSGFAKKDSTEHTVAKR